MKYKELSEITTQELAERLDAAVASYEQMLLNHAISPVANSSSIKIARRDIARIKTALRARELAK